MGTAEHEERHLDAASWAALQAREPGAVAHFARHLATPCEVCETFLLQTQEAPELDALADEALGQLAPAQEDAGAELGWARVRRSITPAAPPLRRSAWSRRAPALVGLAAAAALALVVVRVAPWREGTSDTVESGEGIKGQRPVGLVLSAAAQLPDGRVVPVQEGSVLPPEAVVLLRYEAQEPAQALLVTQGAGDAAPRSLGSFTLLPGSRDLTDAEGELAGVSLEGEQGRYTPPPVAALPGTRLTEDSQTLRAAMEGTADSAFVASLHVDVRAGHTVP
jgi:hypothetical protein